LLFLFSFSDWRRCFGGNKADDQYQKLDDHDAENSDNNATVGLFQMVSLSSNAIGID